MSTLYHNVLIQSIQGKKYIKNECKIKTMYTFQIFEFLSEFMSLLQNKMSNLIY